MSDSDSFINEVTEEVRRDRLFKQLRRYGWIGVLAVLLIVGGTAWREWSKSRVQADAAAFGDALIDALEAEGAEARLAALDAVPAGTDGARIALAMTRASELTAAGRYEEAAAALDAIATDASLPAIYRSIAGFRSATLPGALSLDDRRLRFEGLIASGGLLRLLAEEQLALIDVESGQPAEALARAERIFADSEVTPGLRRRATQLIVALGGDVPAAGAAPVAGN